MAADPDNPDALFQSGVAAHQSRRFDEAIANYDELLEARPDHADALCNRGAALFELGRYGEALASYDRSLAINPRDADVLNNRASILKVLGRYDEAVADYERALEIDPGLLDALLNRGLVQQVLARCEAALESYDRALVIEPGSTKALVGRGHALQGLGRCGEAIASYDSALAIDARLTEALSNRGNAMKEIGHFEEALASYDRALAIKPDDATAHWNRSLILLLTGDFERGWKEFEWRWRWDAFPSKRRNFAQPLWLGDSDISGKTILLHAEQGLGDTIHFVRYANAVARTGAKVVLEVQPALKELLTGFSGAHQVLAAGELLPAFDCHCPLLSLPLAFNTRLDSIPAATPYLAPGKAAVAAWREKLVARDAPLVGLCWKGSPTHRRDRERSIRLAELRPLLDLPGFQFVSLQKELDPAERAISSGSKNFIHLGADFKGTAELVGALDLVISVDTSWAHWAGAIGKPLWIPLQFSPDWRWLVGREDSPWYPGARLFRQSQSGIWRDVIQDIERELRRFVG